MTGFDDRKKAQEVRYAKAEKLEFNVEARCSKLYGLWAAEQLGLSGPEAQTYAMEVVEVNLEEPGFGDILRKIRSDFDAKRLDISDHIMEAELANALEKAKKQLSEQN